MNETTNYHDSVPSGPMEAPPPTPALVILWSRSEPGRCGEVCFLPEGADGSVVYELGRGAVGQDDGSQRAYFIRQRPGENEQQEPLASTGISRTQLHFRHGEGGLEVENLGKAPALLDGKQKRSGTLHYGQTLEIKGQLLLLLTRRPLLIPSLERAAHDFGAPDADGIVGESESAWNLRRRIDFVASQDDHVLVAGESGCGKELISRAIHARSRRAAQPLVSRNAATLPSGLVDAELFGNVANYPNPGMPARPGLVGAAAGSTLFLDEIGELPSELQAHLLRLLDSGEYQRLGDATPLTSDLRLVAATNRDRSELKHDFSARMPLSVEVGGLNQRREDIPLLVRVFLEAKISRDPSLKHRFWTRDGVLVSPRLIARLTTHHYTLHVRELHALLLECLADSEAPWITMPPSVEERTKVVSAEDVTTDALTPAMIKAALDRNEGVIEQTWRELGLTSRHALRRLMKKHGLA